MRSILISSLVCFSGLAPAATDWYMCETNLTITQIRSPRIESDAVYYLDRSGLEAKRSLAEIFFVLPDQEPPSGGYHYQGSGVSAKLTFTDQQRLPVLVLDSDDSRYLNFLTPFDSNTRRVDLESVHSLRVGWSPPDDFKSVDSDIIRLINSDSILGFIEFIGDVVIIDADDGMRTFPLSQTNLVQLANDPVATPGSYIYLDKDIRLHVEDLSVSTNDIGSANTLYLDRLTDSTPSTGPIEIEFDPDRFGGVDIEHHDKDIVPLTHLTPDVVTPTGQRAWTPDPDRIPTVIPNSGLDDLDLRAPVELQYTLTGPTARFACFAELIAGTWSDCELSIATRTSGSSLNTIQTHRLNTESDSVEIVVDLPQGATQLIVRVDPGVNGPIQDHVILRKPRLLIERPSPQFE